MANPRVSLAEAQHLREAGPSGGAHANDAVQAVMDANMWELEVSALMGEVSLDASSSLFRRAQRALFEVKAVLDALTERTVSEESLAHGAGALAGLPLCRWNKKPVQLRFLPPARVDVIGGFLVKSSPVRPRLTVDIAVQIPDECISTNDHMNYRYHDKRILYLAVLARELQASAAGGDDGASPLLLPAAQGGVRVRGFGGSACGSAKPILEIRFAKRFKCSALAVRIIPTISHDAIPRAKLDVARCNVRRRANNGGGEASGAAAVEEAAASPHYTNSIAEDACARDHLAHIHAAGENCEAFASAALLLKVWARQQELDGASGVSGYFLSMVLLHLVRERKVSRQMRALQLFRVALKFLADWLPATLDFWAPSQSAQRAAKRTLRPLAIRPGVGEAAAVSGAALAALRDAFAVVLVGPLGLVNVAARVTPAAATELQQAAAAALAAMRTQPPMVAFTALFINAAQTPCAPATRVADAHFTLALPRVPPASVRAALRDAAADLGWGEAWRRAVFRTLACALGATKRASRLVVRDAHPSEASDWDVRSPPPGPRLHELAAACDAAAAPSDGEVEGDAEGGVAGGLVIACTLGDDAEQIVLRGPAADDAANARAFRDFWGELAELRRFRDGGVVEAVVWSALRKTPHLVSAAMARHALARHVGVRPASLRSSLDSLRPRVPAEQRRAAFAQLVDLFQSLAYDIKRLKGLPLGIHSLSPSCAALSGTSAATLAPHLFAGAPLDTVRQQRALSRLVPAMDVVLKFESSARWPDDLAALRATKVAFCLRIAERLAAEHKRHAVVTDDHLDVAVDGFIFRVHLAVERERTLLGRIADAAPPPATATASPASGDDEKAAAAAKAAAKAELVELEVAHTHRPALCGALQTVALRCPAYSHAVRLAKQWLSAHMLASQIDEAAVDLLVAHGFVGALTLRNEGGGRAKQRGDEASSAAQHAAWAQPPRTAAAGLLRFLNLVGSFDFNGAPLVVPLAGVSITAAQSSVLAARFARERAARGPALYLVALMSGEDRRAATSALESSLDLAEGSAAAAAAARRARSAQDEVPPCIWSRARPEGVALARLGAYGRSAATQLAALMRAGASPTSEAFAQLFTTPTGCYDVLLELHAFGGDDAAVVESVVAVRGAEGGTAKRRRVARAKLTVPVHRNMLVGSAPASKLGQALIGVDPPRAFVRALERRFAKHAVVFAGATTTRGAGSWTTVGIVWRPSAFLPQKLSLATCDGTLALAHGAKEGAPLMALPNIVEMMAGIARAGEGLIRSARWSGVGVAETAY
jgi:U3 small nucleolar RNA-associated protein 22